MLMVSLGVSCFFGLVVSLIFLPMNHFAGKVVVGMSTSPSLTAVHAKFLQLLKTI